MTVSRSVARLLTVAALVAQVPVAPAAAQSGCSDPTAVHSGTKDWIKIAPPRFALDPQTMKDIAADPADPNHLYVTNGNQVMETKDAGCTWSSVYANAAALDIAVQIPSSGPAGRVALVVGEAPGVTIHLSDDGGKTWATSSDAAEDLRGYAPCTGTYQGARGPLQIAASEPSVMYLCTFLRASTFNEPYYSVFVSKDGGQTWDPTIDELAAATGYAARYGGPFSSGRMQLFVDPADPKSVWAVMATLKYWGQPGAPGNAIADVWNATVLHSTDGAATWTTVRRVAPGYYDYVDVTFARRAGGPRSVYVTSRPQAECQSEESGCIFTTDDQGASWRLQPAEFGMTPTVIEAGRGDRHFVVASGQQGTYYYRVDSRRGTWTNISPPDPEQFPLGLDASVGASHSAYFVFSRDAIDRYAGKV